jgi:hypothetical protein
MIGVVTTIMTTTTTATMTDPRMTIAMVGSVHRAKGIRATASFCCSHGSSSALRVPVWRGRQLIESVRSAVVGRPLQEWLLQFCGVRKMSVRMLGRFGVVLFFIALVSACSTFGSHHSERTTSLRSSQCRQSPGSCMYNGAYEHGERDYAEQEAKLLNQASLDALRRNSVR